MPANPPITSGTVLDETSRAFVRRAIAGRLVELDDVKKVVASLMADGETLTPERLGEGLQAAGLLTKWQAKKVLGGKSKGFYLGSYRLLRPLGRGGMGMVYLGEHKIMKRLMALKILPPESLRDQKRIARFKDEARASAQLDHPNIVRAYDCAEAGDKLFIVMEYVDGANLQEAVVRDGLMSIVGALDAIRQSAEGLAHAHGRGIVHRDIKPSNLMLRRDGVIKVSDLGLARIGFQLDPGDDGKKRLTGTADFIAPEQAIDSKTVDARADIYSLGCTWFFLLTGRTPFAGKSVAQRLAKHQTSPVPDVRRHRGDCPQSVADLIMRMMAKRPEDRPPSMSELLVQLDQVRGVPSDGSARQLTTLASQIDTSADDSNLHVTDWDGSSAGGSHIGSAIGVTDMAGDAGRHAEFDFSDLPDPVAVVAKPRTSRPAPTPAKTKKSTDGGPDSQGNQMLLLGIGLALAVIALLAVVIMIVMTFLKEPERSSPRLKQVEDGKGNVIIVNEP